ncbi:YifB family Mg chelatase-like AAA ATPase [Paenibacillus bouchesdurhonensis]|uniref:YifB family Mg chelatase-like AAA ATPase n=1 Tax=Paenibacillus bouchesdurhonensis TaxID=1870990 RepID=UPI000DA5EBD8|nr:YifB family Mg chelatase-like AAA ATPase [Paenibacillus bouchesdurhonensis]
MYSKLFSACLYGIDGKLIEVEVDLSNGIPQTTVVGLPDTAVREAVERVRSAIKNCGYTFPLQRVTINLAPADLRKEGSAFDLAIALAILAASKQIVLPENERVLIIGELSLDGVLRPVSGVISMVDLAKRQGFGAVLLPMDNAEEAMLISGISIYGLNHLNDLAATVDISNPEGEASYHGKAFSKEHSNRKQTSVSPKNGTLVITSFKHLQASKREYSSLLSPKTPSVKDYSDVLGQRHVKRALTIAAAGWHNIMLIGPPGTGKTMLIRRLPSILPALTEEEALEVTKIYSSAGNFKETESDLIRSRPFRSPHHTISAAGLVGGGSIPKPGEVSLSHHGVLFLDELPEFARGALEVLRQPLEEREVTISRTRAAFTFPANFLLAVSMNPCPCGYLGAEPPLPRCTCSPYRVAQYRERISGPLLDRIDMHVEVPRPVNWQTDRQPLSSGEMKAAVLRAQHIQQQRYAKLEIGYNSELNGRALRKYADISREAEQLLQTTFQAIGLSMRAYDRIIKLSRTIADVEGSARIAANHIAEAIQYRQLDRQVTDNLN